MSKKYEKLKTLLMELFQLDQPDLDFGIYRILHARADEISKFLDEDLLPQVTDAFSQYKSADRSELIKKLADMRTAVETAGMNPEESPKVKELEDQIANESVDIAKEESQVYDHLYGFFRRYYSEGDFLSKRVYKPGVYAIPYEGEEVKLHWANADQYYIKTSEYLRDFAFRLNPFADEVNGQDPMRVHFRLADVAEGEHGNIKESDANKRVFILASGEDWIFEENGELIIRFEYRPATLTDWPDDVRDGKTKPPAQKDLLAIAEKRIEEVQTAGLLTWISELQKRHIKADGTESDKSKIQVNLERYTARNTFDYFIHKDLGGFLRRELDFYIKNEVMLLDDIDTSTNNVEKAENNLRALLSKIKVIRSIAHKIIDFLAQLEDFQKKLWLKKKFVVETSYLIRVGIIPEEFYAEIAANDAQRKEWIDLLSIDEIEGDLNTPAYSEPLTGEFLKSFSTLPLNTALFNDDFLHRLLGNIELLDQAVDGLLLHSENFQSLRLIANKFRNQIDCIHIDPPYNTDTSGFLYKNTYQHSSWLSMMWDRLVFANHLLTETGHLRCHIDENEYERLKNLSEMLGIKDAGTVVWDKRNPMTGGSGIALQHEYILWLSNLQKSINQRNVTILTILNKAKEIIDANGGVNSAARQEFSRWIRENNELSGGEKAYSNLDDSGQVYRAVSLRAPEPRTDPRFFEPLIHPRTGRPCSVPPNGFSRAPETLQGMVERGEILFGPDENSQPNQKRVLTDESTMQVKSIIQDAKTGKAYLDQLGLAFPYCHPVSLYEELIGATNQAPGSIVCDYFAGSGTTGHAVINLNRDDGSKRRFILTETGHHFDTAIIPRMVKTTFSPGWSDGKPARFATDEEADRSPRIMKVIRLESYEDALNNLELKRTSTQESLLDLAESKEVNGFREQYMLRYMLDVESRGSQSLLNVAAFTDPTAYKLKVKRPGSDESREVNVDLIETFNWLIGLTVHGIAAPRTFAADFERDDEKRLQIKGRLRQEADGPYWFRTVTGTVPHGRKTFVIWRKLTGDPEQDNLVLDEWFTRQGYSSKDSEYDLIYVNGDNNLENLRSADDTWKVRLIEEDFHRLMFDTEDV
jgi:adenine-specific DNA-methyltransferase